MRLAFEDGFFSRSNHTNETNVFRLGKLKDGLLVKLSSPRKAISDYLIFFLKQLNIKILQQLKEFSGIFEILSMPKKFGASWGQP